MPEAAPPQTDSVPSLSPSQDAGSMASLLGAVARTGHGALVEGTLVAEMYRVERPIGEGGMGVVYLARDRTLDRDVAVKLCTSLGPSAMHRIQREAMALAKLAHPNVVVVYQAGEVGGRFFIAMEHVTGGTATTWIAEGERSVAQILALYAAAGDGLAAAHEVGLVHRDFKPDNILVGADGRPRVADFGLARVVTDTEPRGPRVETGGCSGSKTGAVMGTLAYMAPEQLEGRVVDARADQYAFAVSLWEALFGGRPTKADTVLATDPERLRLPRSSATGKTVPRHVVAALQRALAVDPDERWPSMTALLAELRRDPAARRRRAIAAVGAVVLVAAGAITAALWGPEEPPPQCMDAPSRIADVWNTDRTAAIALVVGDAAWPAIEARVAARVDAWTEQHTAACRATRVYGSASEDLLDERMLCLDARKQELEAILRVLEHGSANAVSNAAAAIDMLPGSADCMSAQPFGTPLPPDPRLREDIRAAQAAVAEAAASALDPTALDALDKADRGERLARETQWRPIVARSLAVRAAVLHELGRLREALEVYAEAQYQALSSGSDELAVQTLADGAQALAEIGHFGEAIQALTLARAIWERTGNGAESGQRLLMAVANVAWQDGRPDDALEAVLQQVELAEQAFAPTATSQATNQYNLAIAYYNVGRHDESSAALERAIELTRSSLGDDHPSMGTYLGQQARHLLERGELAKAQAVAERSLAIQEAWFGAHDARLLLALELLGDTLRRRGDIPAAKAVATRALELHQLWHPDAPEVAHGEANLAVLAVEEGDFAAAAPLAESALARIEQTHGSDRSELINALLLRGYIARERPDRDLEASLRDLSRAHEIAQDRLGSDDPETVNIEIELANTLLARGDHERAAELLEARLRELPQLGLPAQVSAEVRLALARVVADSGALPRACDLVAGAQEELRTVDVPVLSATASAWRSEHCG